MALEIVGVLQSRGTIDEDRLAQAFGAPATPPIRRGYGRTAHAIL